MQTGDHGRPTRDSVAIIAIPLPFLLVTFVAKEILDEPSGDVTWQGYVVSFLIGAAATAVVALAIWAPIRRR